MHSRIRAKLTRHFGCDFRSGIAAIEAAIASGTLASDTPVSEALSKVEKAAGWDSLTEGIDWVELECYTEERRMRMETVADLLQLLKSFEAAP